MMEIEFGTIEQSSEGQRLVRPHDMAHKDFMLMQKHEWPEFHRIVIGRWTYNYHKQKEIEWWCNENACGRWFHSEGHEVYYFESRNAAIHFKLRWFSEIAPSAN
jgi:hypothetical protein